MNCGFVQRVIPFLISLICNFNGIILIYLFLLFIASFAIKLFGGHCAIRAQGYGMKSSGLCLKLCLTNSFLLNVSKCVGKAFEMTGWTTCVYVLGFDISLKPL